MGQTGPKKHWSHGGNGLKEWILPQPFGFEAWWRHTLKTTRSWHWACWQNFKPPRQANGWWRRLVATPACARAGTGICSASSKGPLSSKGGFFASFPQGNLPGNLKRRLSRIGGFHPPWGQGRAVQYSSPLQASPAKAGRSGIPGLRTGK